MLKDQLAGIAPGALQILKPSDYHRMYPILSDCHVDPTRAPALLCAKLMQGVFLRLLPISLLRISYAVHLFSIYKQNPL